MKVLSYYQLGFGTGFGTLRVCRGTPIRLAISCCVASFLACPPLFFVPFDSLRDSPIKSLLLLAFFASITAPLPLLCNEAFLPGPGETSLLLLAFFASVLLLRQVSLTTEIE